MAGIGASRSAQVRAWVSARAVSSGRPVSAALVCETAVLHLGVGGATMTVDAPPGWPEVRHATDALGGRLAELQLTVGEGPGMDVRRTGGPVLVADLEADSSQRRWPLFAPLAVEAGAAALFTLPLGVGVIRAGQLALHRIGAGPLERAAVGHSLAFADLLLRLLLGPWDGSTDLPLHDPQVHQATGMVAAQLGVGIEDAFARLRALAFADRRPLAELAADVVARRLRLAADGTSDAEPS